MFTSRTPMARLRAALGSSLCSVRAATIPDVHPAADFVKGNGNVVGEPGPGRDLDVPKPSEEARSGFIIVRLGEISASHDADDFKNLVDLAERFKLGGLLRVIDDYDLGRGTRLVTSVEPGKLREMEAKARDSAFAPMRSLLAYWRLDARKRGDEIDKIVKILRTTPGIADAYLELVPSDPQVNPGDDPYSGQQGHLDPAPDGIDARWAWTQPDSSGNGISVCDMEQGWLLTHEDLASASPTLIHGDNNPSSYDHGCAVLGVMVADDNTLGVIGIAPNAGPVRCSSWYSAGGGANVADAILAAIAALNPGDALLIEVQISYKPAEIVNDYFDAIRLASALGIVVFEAAGNGNDDLDAYTNALGEQILNPVSADFRDSGATMVGACLSPLPHNRKLASNFGGRVDCFAWGEDVVTTGYGTLDNGGGDVDAEYASSFQNTSAATPIIAGAGLLVQGMHEATTGARLSPMQMRLLLSNPATGTTQGGGVAGNIGTMPDLRAIIEDELGLSADVYLRDNIGDDGTVPTAGGISASPDIIARPSLVADPQAAFGEGSGTENSTTLGYKIEAGQPNYLYARMKNRGGSDANGVTAQIYWSPVSTLVTPDMWTPIGTTPPVNVPMGDTLEVTDPVTWASGDIPGEGHYCFVGVLDHPADPAPVLPAPTDWDGFRAFIRSQNNVTWRNFNVVDELEDPEADPSEQPFLIANFPDKRRFFDFRIERRVPRQVRIWLDLPMQIAGAFCGDLDLKCKVDRKKQRMLILLPSATRLAVPKVLLPAKARFECRFVIEGLSKYARPGNMISIGQFFEEQEVGRVTWHFAKKRHQKDLC